MTALRPLNTAALARPGAPRTRWYALQAGLLGAALLAFAVSVHLGAAPGGAALRASPPSPPTDDGETVALLRPSLSARQHLVLIVSDPALGSEIRERVVSGDLVSSEFGAYARPLAAVEVIVAGSDAPLSTLEAGLRELEQQCVAESCAAIRILDLRSSPQQ